MRCHCGDERGYERCCGRFIDGHELAPDAVALMRSRYSAYVLGAGEYLVETTVPQKRVCEDAELIAAHAANTTWLKLDVLSSKLGDGAALVEFKAYYKEAEGAVRVHHELSSFLKIEGRWYYDAGKLFKAEVGRNEACPCGSGKKFKKCCMV